MKKSYISMLFLIIRVLQGDISKFNKKKCNMLNNYPLPQNSVGCWVIVINYSLSWLRNNEI